MEHLYQYTSTEIDKIIPALYTAQMQVKPAVKDAVNPYFKSKYADYSTVWEACRDAIFNNEMFVTYTLTPSGDGTAMVTTLWHISGQYIASVMPMAIAQETPQGQGSAITYARRYGLVSLMNVIVVGDDDDGNAGSTPPDKPTEKPKTDLVDWTKLKKTGLAAGWQETDIGNWIKAKREEGNQDIQIFNAGMQKFKNAPVKGVTK